MDYFNGFPNYRRNTFQTITGRITEMQPLRTDGGECSQLVTIEDMEGGEVDFVVTPATYMADFVTLYVGMEAHFVYNADLPVPLIYPPRYTAVAVVSTISATNVMVGFFNNRLVSADNSLQLNVTEDVPVVTSNNQIYSGSLARRYLLVMYGATTRSMPPQTTPDRIVVMCEW